MAVICNRCVTLSCCFTASVLVFLFVKSEQPQLGDCVWYGRVSCRLLEVPQVNTPSESQISCSIIQYHSEDDLIKYQLREVTHFKRRSLNPHIFSFLFLRRPSSKWIVLFSWLFRLSINTISAFWNSSFFHLLTGFQTAFSIWISHAINSVIFCKCKLPFDCHSSFL